MSIFSDVAESVSSWFHGPKKEAPAAAPPPVDVGRDNGVELCRVPAFHMGQTMYQGLKKVGLDASHQWVQGPGFAHGMGRDPDSWNPLKVAWTDHTARAAKEAKAGNLNCVPIPGVDPADVSRHSQPGTKIDPLYKLVTDNCQTAARGALNEAHFEKSNRCDAPEPTQASETYESMMSMETGPQTSLFSNYAS